MVVYNHNSTYHCLQPVFLQILVRNTLYSAPTYEKFFNVIVEVLIHNFMIDRYGKDVF